MTKEVSKLLANFQQKTKTQQKQFKEGNQRVSSPSIIHRIKVCHAVPQLVAFEQLIAPSKIPADPSNPRFTNQQANYQRGIFPPLLVSNLLL